MTIRKFEALVRVTSPTSATTKVVANIDPNIGFLPNSLLEFVMKHLAGVILAKLQAAAKKASQHPATNAHAKKMRQEKNFYQDWLMLKFRSMCDSNGWEMPPVEAFELTEKDLNHEQSRIHFTRARTFDDTVVDNLTSLSGHDDERSPTGEYLSDISVDSKKSTWTNPIATYLREGKSKAEREKADEIAAIRRKMAEEMKPKEIPTHKLERLAELKKAKARRGGHRRVAPNSANPDTGFGIRRSSEQFSKELESYNTVTRFFVVLSLVVLLFTMLHPEPLLKYLPVELLPSVPWKVILFKDTCAFFYILLCAVPHFLLCDVSLIYAFDSLELGSKTGRQVRKFYSDKVRLGVAAGSLGIVALSIFKSAVKVWTRCLLWMISLSYSYVDDKYLSKTESFYLGFVQHLPAQVQKGTELSVGYARHAIVLVSWSWRQMISLLYYLFIQSNFIGRSVYFEILAFVGMLQDIYQREHDHFSESINEFEGKAMMISWRQEAFDTARLLFSYSAVFLLALLILFNLSNRVAQNGPAENSPRVTHNPERAFTTAVSSISVDSVSTGPAILPSRSGGGTTHATIPEDEEIHGNHHLDANHLASDSESTTSARLRMRFRFKAMKSDSSPQASSVPPKPKKEKVKKSHSTTF
jgi:hypothetical protein